MSVDRSRKSKRKRNKEKQSGLRGDNEEEVDVVETRGRPADWTHEQDEWFKTVYVIHDAKVAPFNGKASNDADLGSWVNGKWVEFAVRFKKELEAGEKSLEEKERSFKDRFMNRRGYKLKRMAAKLKAQTDTPLLQLTQARSTVPKGYSKFVDVHREDLNDDIKADRVADKRLNHVDHVVMFNHRMGEKWRALPPEEQEEWSRVATTHTFERVFSNQSKLHAELYSLLRGSQGFDEHQTGDSAHLVVSAFRDMHGVLQNRMVLVEGVNTKSGAKKILEMCPALTDHFIPEWDAYIAQAVPDTIADVRAEQILNENPKENPPPLLSNAGDEDDEDGLTVAALRNLIDQFFVDLWAYAQRDGNRDIPWDDISANPTKHVLSSSLPASVPLLKPRSWKAHQLYLVRTTILKHQASAPLHPFVLFADQTTEGGAESESETPKSPVSIHGDMDGGPGEADSDGSGGPASSEDEEESSIDVENPPPSSLRVGRKGGQVVSDDSDLDADRSPTRRRTPQSPSPHHRGVNSPRDEAIGGGDMRVVEHDTAHLRSVFMPLQIPQVIPRDGVHPVISGEVATAMDHQANSPSPHARASPSPAPPPHGMLNFDKRPRSTEIPPEHDGATASSASTEQPAKKRKPSSNRSTRGDGANALASGSPRPPVSSKRSRRPTQRYQGSA